MKLTLTILLVAGGLFSAIADKTPSELKTLQVIRAKKIKGIDDAYIQALEKLKIKYTKRGDLDSAKAVNAALLEMEQNQEQKAESAPTSNLPVEENKAKVHSNDGFVRLKDGVDVFDGSLVTYCDVPEDVEGWKVSVRNSQNHDPLKFEVEEKGMIYIGVSGDRFANELVRAGWTKVDTVGIEGPKGKWVVGMVVLQCELDIGEYSIPSKGDLGSRLLKK